MHTFFIAPTGFGVGLTSISLGLVRALQRAGLKVGFFKPIAQPISSTPAMTKYIHAISHLAKTESRHDGCAASAKKIG